MQSKSLQSILDFLDLYLLLSVACNPVDVIKNRLMSQAAGKEKMYSGMIDCAVKVFNFKLIIIESDC